jgi:hypothetical protein
MTNRVVIIMPTRGRPAGAMAAYESAVATATEEDTKVIATLDEGDPYLGGYSGALLEDSVVCGGNMIERTNIAAAEVVERFDIIGWMADDNRMLTEGWDRAVLDAMRDGVGFVNLNDLFWSEKAPNDKPVNTFTRASIVRALGYFANPVTSHHFMDDTWRILGNSTDSSVYLESVICEHLHPVNKKAEWDASYRETEDMGLIRAEQQLFMNWIWTQFKEDRLKVKACL